MSKKVHSDVGTHFDLMNYARAHSFGELHFKCDESTGLLAIIAIHNTNRGPALGGCRYISYESHDAAIRDAIRLARGMSMKAAVSGLHLGGGKSVLIKTPAQTDRKAMYQKFGEFIDELNGKYITAVDSGTEEDDLLAVREMTPHVAGLTTPGYTINDPSQLTALGVRMGIMAAVKHKFQRDDIEGMHVVIQGVGHVGYYLAKELHALGARLTVCDADHDKVQRVVDEFGAQKVLKDQVHKIPCQVFAPCALGGYLNDITIRDIQAPIVAGAANNQLAEERHGQMLFDKGILYAPDYVINAGGLIHVEAQLHHRTEDEDIARVKNIYNTLTEIFERSQAEKRPTSAIADDLALERIANPEL